MIHVIARIELRPGCRERFLACFRELAPKVLTERGCLGYVPAVEVPTALRPEPPDENAVTVIETWQSLGDLEAHLAAPHMAEFRRQTGDLRNRVTLTVLEPR
jgi:quinol monooxygenase YgiN